MILQLSLILENLGFLSFSFSHPDIQVGASVVQEQCEAEGDMSLQQRVLMGAGTALEGSSELVEDEIAAGMFKMSTMSRHLV